MNKDDCTAYKGEFFTIEWFFDEKGFSQSFEYYLELSNSQKRKLYLLFKRIGDFGKISDKTKFRYEGNDIFAFKPQPDRFLSFFVKDRKIIIATAFMKKSQKLPKNEMNKAVSFRVDYYKRIEKGEYYE